MDAWVGVIGVGLTILGQLAIRRRTDVEPPNETAPFSLGYVVWTVPGDSC